MTKEEGSPDPSASHGAPTPQDEAKSALDSLLSIFADVKGGEGVTAVLLTVNVLLLLVAYYLLKTVREPLILISGGGAEAKSYATAGQAVLLIGVVQIYAALTKRLPRVTLITVVSLFFASNLVLFYVLALFKVPYLAVAFFLWLGIFSLMVIAQFWSFANDIYTPAQGKRLFAIVGIGSSVGAVAGSYFAKLLIKPVGPFPMMLIAAAILVVCLGITRYINAREVDRANRATPGGGADKPVGGKGGFAMLLEDRYLLLIGAVILLLNWVNTTGEYILDKNILAAAAERIEGLASMTKEAQDKALGDFVGEFRGDFFFWVNLIGAVFQLFLVSRVFKYIGVRAALYSLPIIGLVGYSIMAFVPILSLVRLAKIAENSCDYSLYNTSKQAVWLPTSREAKYNAKAAVDTFIVRAGDLLSAGGVAVGAYLGLRSTQFAFINLALIGVWLVAVVLIGREHKKRTEDEEAAEAAAVKPKAA
jgi:ATP:ADP antiporter, AAA family